MTIHGPGSSMRRKEDPRLLTGRGKFAADFRLPGLLQALDRLHQADLELRSSPPDERLVLERLIFDLAK